MRRIAEFCEHLKEGLEYTRPAETPEPLPYAVPVSKFSGQYSPSNAVDREILDCLQEFTVVMPRFSPPRLHRVEHFKCDQPILFRHSCQHVRPPDAGHAVIRINTDSGTRQNCMAGIPSTQPNSRTLASIAPIGSDLPANSRTDLFLHRICCGGTCVPHGLRIGTILSRPVAGNWARSRRDDGNRCWTEPRSRRQAASLITRLDWPARTKYPAHYHGAGCGCHGTGKEFEEFMPEARHLPRPPNGSEFGRRVARGANETHRTRRLSRALEDALPERAWR